MDLYTFYTHECYDATPEINALRTHVHGKTLFVGDYAAAALAPEFEDSHAALPDPQVLFECQTRNEQGVRYAGVKLDKLPYPDDSFDTVVAAYLGLQHHKTVLQEILRVTNTTAIILEADPSSEYVQILNNVLPKESTHPKKILTFVNEYDIIQEAIISTYTFSKELFTEYFVAEFKYHEDTSVPEDQILPEYKKRGEERAVLYTLTKKDSNAS